jgi:hypothetical protein
MVTRFSGAPTAVLVVIDGAAPVAFTPSSFIDLGVGAHSMVFSRSCIIKVRGIAAGGYGGTFSGNVTASAPGGGQGAYNNVGIDVTIVAGLTYTATVGAAPSGTTKFALGGTVYLELSGGLSGSIDTAVAGAGGLADHCGAGHGLFAAAEVQQYVQRVTIPKLRRYLIRARRRDAAVSQHLMRNHRRVPHLQGPPVQRWTVFAQPQEPLITVPQ